MVLIIGKRYHMLDKRNNDAEPCTPDLLSTCTPDSHLTLYVDLALHLNLILDWNWIWAVECNIESPWSHYVDYSSNAFFIIYMNVSVSIIMSLLSSSQFATVGWHFSWWQFSGVSGWCHFEWHVSDLQVGGQCESAAFWAWEGHIRSCGGCLGSHVSWSNRAWLWTGSLQFWSQQDWRRLHLP